MRSSSVRGCRTTSKTARWSWSRFMVPWLMTPPPHWLECIVSLSALLCGLHRKTGCDRPTPEGSPWGLPSQWLWRKAAIRDRAPDDHAYPEYIFRNCYARQCEFARRAPQARCADTRTDQNYD